MSYTIGETAQLLGVPASTLRYYDKEGLLPHVDRTTGGIRRFTEQDIEGLRLVECLKQTGLSIKDIRQFMSWTQEGDATIPQRREMFHQRREAVLAQMADLQSTLDIIDYKCWFYDTANEAGTTSVPAETPDAELPEKIRSARRRLKATTDATKPGKVA